MFTRWIISNRSFLLLIATFVLTACGGGGGSGQASTSTTSSSTSSTLASPLDRVITNARFLLFPNPQKQGFGGSDQTNTVAYASAYYAAIDPSNERTNFADWKSKNGFTATDDGVNQVTVVFGDKDDLGYGRRMTARRNANGCLAFFVENYLVDTGSSTGYVYSTLNVDAAVVRSSQRFVSYSAIEYCDLDGPGGSNGHNFVKFFSFPTAASNPSQPRNLVVDQDGLGTKAMPSLCVSCHGGRADALNSDGTFSIVGNAVSQQAGDTTSRLQVLKVHTFDFSSLSDGVTGESRARSAQEDKMRLINQWIRDSYSNTGVNEWDGAIAQSFIQTAYGNAGSSTLSGSYNDTAATAFVPDTSWTTNGQATLYKDVVGPLCMTCHILRGTVNQSDISFTQWSQFSGYADRIKAHVFDRGNMPLVKLGFEKLWLSSTLPTEISNFLDTTSFPPDRSGSTVLKPGRPLPDPGPSRIVNQGSVQLNGENSLYSSAYQWSIVSENGGAVTHATLTNPTSVNPTFNSTADGTYVINLTTTNSGLSGSKTIKLVVNDAFRFTGSKKPADITFSDVQALFTSATCNNACHKSSLTLAVKPPVSYLLSDYGGDSAAFLAAVKSRINFTDIEASPLLRKPSGHHHNGGLVGGPGGGFDIDDSQVLKDPGDVKRTDYDLLLSWILNGAPQ